MQCVCQHLSLPPQVVLHSAASVSDSSMSSRQPCASELRAVCRFRFQFDLAVRQHACQICGKLSPTSCAMLLVRVRVRVCDRVPTQGSRVCLGAGQAVPNPASSRRWPSVRDPSRGASASVWPTLRLARRSPGCGASHALALAPPRWDVARGGTAPGRLQGASLAPGTASSRSAVARCVLGPERPAVARCALGPGRLEVGEAFYESISVSASTYASSPQFARSSGAARSLAPLRLPGCVHMQPFGC